MYALFILGEIEEYYATYDLIVVSPDRERLEKHEQSLLAAEREVRRRRQKFQEILKQFPEFAELCPQAAEKPKGDKRSKEYQAAATAINKKYDVLQREWSARRSSYRADREDEAYRLFLDLEKLHFTEVDKSSVMGYVGYSSGEASYIIKEVDLL